LLANQTTAVTVSLVWLLAVEGLLVNITSTPTLYDRLPGGARGVIAREAVEGAHTPLWAAAGCAVAYAGRARRRRHAAPHRSRRHVTEVRPCTYQHATTVADARIAAALEGRVAGDEDQRDDDCAAGALGPAP
jgi:hypothetical protein